MNRLRAELYLALAEALAPVEPAGWLALPGREWPLYECASHLAVRSPVAQRAVQALAQIPAETITRRKARYTALFCGSGRPQFWLYESVHRSGHLFGPETLAVEKWYRAAGVEVSDAELPDHASIELAFLAHLARQSSFSRALERRFIMHHAGRWLPVLGRGLDSTADLVYSPIGALLAGWLEEAIRPDKSAVPLANSDGRLPVIQIIDQCSLCGFCARVCPTRALSIHENQFEAVLMLSPEACILCGKCERVCEFQAIQVLPRPAIKAPPRESVHSPGDLLVLRRSALATCRACRAVIASQAELEFVSHQLGFPAWLDYCPECRVRFI